MSSVPSGTTATAAGAAGKKPRTNSAAKKTGGVNAPVFLRKAYKMISTANPDIASWADNGTTFVVKDTEKFAADIIPEFFKHNNWSSFVRQLHFYGFRKIKADPLRIKDAESSQESKYWKFRHEKFQEGREDLLAEIKKSSQNESAEKQEVEGLKQEVKTLREELSTMSTEMDELKALVNTLIQNQNQHRHAHAEPAVSVNTHASGKKRKFSLTESPSPVKSGAPEAPVLSLEPLPVRSEISPAMPPGSPNQRVESHGLAPLSSQDEEMLARVLASDLDDCKLPDDNSVPDAVGSDVKKLDPEVEKKIHTALAELPDRIQQMFTDLHPEALRAQADALAALVVSASKEASEHQQQQQQYLLDNPELAAAVLEAYLNKRRSEHFERPGNSEHFELPDHPQHMLLDGEESEPRVQSHADTTSTGTPGVEGGAF